MTTIDAGSFRSAPRTAARWGLGLAIALALHGGLAVLLISRTIGVEPVGAPAAAVLIDLAPPPAPAPPPPPPPEPQVLQPEPPPPEPPPSPPEPPPPEPPPPPPEIALPPPDPVPPPHPAVTLPKPPPKPKLPKPVAQLAPPPLPLPAPAAPPVVPPPQPVVPAGPPPAVVAAARANWQSQLAGRLEQFKRYPRAAQEQRQQGVVYLHFALDRQGNVLSSRIERGSGYEMLDQEAMALIQRAQPLPPPPPEIGGSRIELVVPIRFALHS